VLNQKSELYFPPGEPSVKVIDFKYSRRDEIMHTHDFYEIVLVKKGSGVHITEKGSYPVFHGDIFLIKPGLAHSYEEIKGLEIVNVIFIPEAINVPLYDLKSIHAYRDFFESDLSSKCTLNLDAEQLNTANEIILAMRNEEQNRQLGYEYFMHLGLMRLIGLICRSYSNSSDSQSKNVTKLIHVFRFIEHRYQEKIQMDELSAIAGMSPSSLLREFCKEVGETPINYLINLRLEKAAKMLRETSESITQISYLVGFHDSNYFSKMFRRKYSCCPRDYKAVHKKNLIQP